MRRHSCAGVAALATAARNGGCGSRTERPGPVGTDISGFPAVLGPEATEPEHAGAVLQIRRNPGLP